MSGWEFWAVAILLSTPVPGWICRLVGAGFYAIPGVAPRIDAASDWLAKKLIAGIDNVRARLPKSKRVLELEEATRKLQEAVERARAAQAARAAALGLPPDWDRTLGLTPEETRTKPIPMDVVERAYKRRMRECHPDRGGDPKLAARVNQTMDAVRSYVRKAKS